MEELKLEKKRMLLFYAHITLTHLYKMYTYHSRR